VSVAPEETTLGLDNRKLAMWAFLGSEFLFFGAFITAYFIFINDTNGGPGVELFDIPYTSISSFVLLMSSLTMVLAHHAHVKGDLKRMRMWILATALQGLVFIGGQAFEFITFVNEGLTIQTSPFASSFFVLTGFHGAHVTVGIIILLGLYALSLTGKIKSDQHVKTEIVGLYWHFVDIIWVLIFVVVYLIPAG
jgi:heme/copper-type cytochrome/quinol oxidase subunit 3